MYYSIQIRESWHLCEIQYAFLFPKDTGGEEKLDAGIHQFLLGCSINDQTPQLSFSRVDLVKMEMASDCIATAFCDAVERFLALLGPVKSSTWN